MDKTAALSQGSISSINTLNQTLDSHGSTGTGTGSASTTSEFINHGLLIWTQTRQRWVGNRSSDKQAHQSRGPKLNWNATYDSLLGSSKTFPQPVPLSEMVDFLVDIWEQEGMYD